LSNSDRMKSPPDFKVGKRSRRAVFDLRDMLIAVEDAEDEALHTEKITLAKKRNRDRKKTQKVNFDFLKSEKRIIVERHFTLSDELKLKWAKSLNTQPSNATENAQVYPKIIRELDELYNCRLEKRIQELKIQYEKKAEVQKNARDYKILEAKKKNEAEEEKQKRMREKILAERQKTEEEMHKKEEENKRQEALKEEHTQKLTTEVNDEHLASAAPSLPTPSLAPTAVPVVSSQPRQALDPRLAQLPKVDAIAAEIANWDEKCAKLLRPESDEDKDVAMKINRAIAVPVGALTQRSGQDLKTQVSKISNLLNAKDLPNHSLTADFAIVTIARRLVRLAEEQLSSNEQAACATAAAIVALWIQRPQFGQLFMAHLYTACPVLLPNGSEMYDEQNEQRLRTYAGLCRLFAALASSDCPPGAQKHPFGLEHVWKTLVAVLILPTATELTSQILYEILRFSGKKLQKSYGKQFQKLLNFIMEIYLSKAVGGPAARLKSLLVEVSQNKDGLFGEPPGALPYNFWATKDEYTGVIVGD